MSQVGRVFNWKWKFYSKIQVCQALVRVFAFYQATDENWTSISTYLCSSSPQLHFISHTVILLLMKVQSQQGLPHSLIRKKKRIFFVCFPFVIGISFLLHKVWLFSFSLSPTLYPSMVCRAVERACSSAGVGARIEYLLCSTGCEKAACYTPSLCETL